MADPTCPRCGDTPQPCPGRLTRCGCGQWACDPDGLRGTAPPLRKPGGWHG
jgi:hypothetical protein